ncbi:MAG: MoaD/ThiS family protein [Planctomycetota bacterium]|nr:MoaD/ThiS family protein [Planctomycetota bacterium]
MDIVVHFSAQLKQELGISTARVALRETASTTDLVERLAEQYGKQFESFALDHDGRLLPSILLCINGTQVERNQSHALSASDEVHFVSAISGG